MTTTDTNEREQRSAREAWAKMEARLQGEPVNPAWATWNERAAASAETALAPTASGAADSSASHAEVSATEPDDARYADLSAQGPNAASAARKLTGKTRRSLVRFALAATAAAAVVAAFTPAGNRALADILNRFTMQDVVLIQESDMRDMVNLVYNDGGRFESSNRYGNFESVSLGKFDMDDTPEGIRDELGYTPIVSPDGTAVTLSMSMGTKTVMQLNVAEVNETMRRLGAPYLFPEEADGRAITLTYPAMIYYNFNPNSEQGDDWAILQQSNMPTVEFDDTFPVEETMNAVIHFPYLPDSLKNSLEHSAVSSGKLPMPMYANGEARQLDVNGVKATYVYDEESKLYTAFWIKNGQLFQFDAKAVFRSDEAGMLEFLKGLVAQ